MADEDPDDSKLELPKLGFRRRKKDVAPEPEPAPAPPADEAPTEVIAAQPPAAARAPESERPTEVLAPVEEPDDDAGAIDLFEDEQDEQGEQDDEPAPVKERRERTPVHIDARAAAVLTGLIVGLVGVALTYGFQEGCAAVKGTGSCGGIGLVLLVVVLIAMLFAGSALFKTFGVPDAMSTSGLGVGIIAVVTVLFLLGLVDRWYAVVVIPVLGAIAYLLAWWASSSFGAAADAD